MVISKEEAENVKQQLMEHIDSTFPEDKKESAKTQVMEMDEAQLENFLIKNNLIKSEEQNEKNPEEKMQCVFCAIVAGKIPSYKLEENKDAVAVLEINPVSKGHTIVIPRKHLSDSSDLPKAVFSLAKTLAKKIKSKLKPKKITIISSNTFGHEILNIIPVYKEESISSERKKAPQEELIKLQIELEKKIKIPKPRKVKIVEEIKKIEKDIEKKIIPWFPNRIP